MNSKLENDSIAVLGAMRTIGECAALNRLRAVEAEAKQLGWSLHRYATNGNASNGGSWERKYALHPAHLPRPRRYSQCVGAKFWVNREGRGPRCEFFRMLEWLSGRITNHAGNASASESATAPKV